MGVSCSTRSAIATEAVPDADNTSKNNMANSKSKLSIFSRSSSTNVVCEKIPEDVADSKDCDTRDCNQEILPEPEKVIEEPAECETKKIRLTPVDPKIPNLSELSRDLIKMTCGRMDAVVTSEERTIYIYHCAEFSDSVVERNFLQQLVYPKLREHCINNGCELVTYDLQLGFKDEFCFNYTLRGFARQVMRQCVVPDRRALLTIFLNDKYGLYWCPLTVPKDAFDGVLKKLTEEDSHFLLQWYVLDENRIPASYVLKPISSNINKYQSHCDTEYKDGYREWEKHLIRLHHVLFQASPLEFQNKICKSAMDESLEEFVFSNVWPKELVFWLRRRFTEGTETKVNWSVKANFFDICVDRPDDIAKARLRNLSDRLSGRIHPLQKLDIQVEWSGNGINLDNPEHATYLTDFCAKYQEILKPRIDEEILRKQDPEIRCRKSVSRGLSKTLYLEIQQQTTFCQNIAEPFYGNESLLESVENYIRTGHVDGSESSEEPTRALLLHGVVGAGKSAIMAEIARRYCTIDGWTSGVAVVRFVEASTRCENIDELLVSIREQIAVLVGLPVMAVYQLDELTLERLLDKVVSETPLIVLLDGVEELSDDKPDVNWLPKQLPANTRIVISTRTDSAWMKAIEEMLSSTNVIAVSPITTDDAVNIIQNRFSERGRKIPPEIQNRFQEDLISPTPLQVTVLTMLLLEDDISVEKKFELIQNSTEELIHEVFAFLEEHFSSMCMRKIGSYLTCCRHGLADSEILDVLSRDKEVMECIMPYHKSLFRVVPCFIWLYIKHFLRPLLTERSTHGLLVYRWRHCIVRNVVKSRYGDSLADCERMLLAYYRGSLACPVAATKDKKTSIASDTVRSAINADMCYIRSQELQYETCYNGRKLDELPWLLYRQGELQELTEILSSVSWLVAKLTVSGLASAVHDIDMCLAKLDHGKNKSSLAFIRQLIVRLAAVCVDDPKQLAPQLHLRSSCGDIAVPDSLPIVREFFRQCAKNPTPTLTPTADVEEILRLTYRHRQTVDDGDGHGDQSSVFGGFFGFRNEPDYVISVSPRLGRLQVWNIRTRRAVRTLNSLQQPKDVKVCDRYKAVVLCNRELKVYDLDSGELVCALKGVLNIRMPFFGVHDAEHTIAMARNRMYVNMMSNVTGEMVTTFKVGEDRFMDSMLTSDNGEKCVCGDAVQKPFPLLVWDLHKRKLIYDLRIQGHEFLTKVSAISKDGHYVTCACKELEDPDPTFVVVYDLQSGSLFKKWKGTYNPTGVAMSQSLVVSGHENGTVCVWDLISGSLKHELIGHSHGPDFLRLSHNGKRCVTWSTTGRDNTIRLWDLDQGSCLGTFYSGCKVSCCDISPDGSLVIVGLPGLNEIVTLAPPGELQPATEESVFGDASRDGAIFDVADT